MKFVDRHQDRRISPYTGMTRESWIDAGKYILNGMFENIDGIDSPFIMPRCETDITYPHKNSSTKQGFIEKKAEIFEGIARSFFIASVLIKDDPDVQVCGIKLRDYYSLHILRACTKGDNEYVENYNDMQKIFDFDNPQRCFQQTVESCALVIGLEVCREQIWAKYTQEERDRIAELISSFADSYTVPQNWRFFNMLDMAFLNMEGYTIDKKKMVDHAQAVLNYYVGNGWYRDGQSFDFYSCWAFNLYAPIWNKWYGYENEPYIAKRFEKNTNELMNNFPAFFDRDGFTLMWWKSSIYRNSASCPLFSDLFLNETVADPGLSRRIVSGSLLQFLSRDDFLYKGVPTLGFYGQFSPLVQGYSCAESPLWLGKAFLCLMLPKEHPYWTDVENNGVWNELGDDVNEKTLDGPALCITDHGKNGETVLRTGKVYKSPDDIRGMWDYGKLNYNSKYPWEATPGTKSIDEINKADVKCESQQYVLFDRGSKAVSRGNAIYWCGEREGVLYRRQFFNADIRTEQHWFQALNLADFPVNRGIMRVDKLRLIKKPVKITLGSYGFPDNGETEIIRKTRVMQDGSKAQAIILIGHDHNGVQRQMAMTCYKGWEQIDVVKSCGTNPDSESSIVIYASMSSRRNYDGAEPYILISQTITAEIREDSEIGCVFSDDEIFSIKSISMIDRYGTGAYGPITINMNDGSIKKVDYEMIESYF